ncbi:MAG: LapA family protein [Actinomycetota bacterium]
MIAFIIKNSDKVKIDFVFFSAQTSLIWLIILLFAIGALVGVLLSQLYRRRRSGGAGQQHGRTDG